MLRHVPRLAALFLLLVLLIALPACSSCGGGKENNQSDGGTTQPDMGDDPDGTGPNNGTDTDVTDPDMGEPTTDEVIISCDNNTWAPPAAGLCDTTAGTGPAVLFQVGSVLTATAVYQNGTVLVSGTGDNATITCVGCDCAEQAQGATTVTCADGALSPSMINPHDHITFSLSWPQQHGTERYEHRHDWRRGLRGHSSVGTSPGSDDSREGVLYGELRMLLGGATSVAGSSSATDARGLIRNLDKASDVEGLVGIDVDYRTFPLGDSSPTFRTSGCDYPNIDSATRAANAGVYLPHIAEGIDEEAHNEFRCLSSSDGGGIDALRANTSIIHGIGLSVTDIAAVAADGAKLVWSPRSNIDLYGNTARVTTYKNFGVTIALGTDWSASGSMNVLRELKCADYLNKEHYNRVFTDRELWMMTTYNAAVAMGADTQIGSLAEGFVADLALFDGRVGQNYRAVIDADAEHVHLVLRGGTPLYGDDNIIAALVPAGELDQCEAFDVCGNDRRVCAQRDAGLTMAAIRSSVDQNAYPLFFCGTPDREPSCVPARENEYSGVVMANDADGDGIADADDICPAVFTPIRPMDNSAQNDFDTDEIGDDCDICPLSDEASCGMLDPNDRDADGIPNLEDNCPGIPNADQANSDGDPYGDVCDPCPDVDNTVSLACPATIYEIRSGAFTTGDSVLLSNVIVTAASTRAFQLQVPDSSPDYAGVPNSGLFVFAGTMATIPAIGDIISVQGRVDMFGGSLQLTGLSNLTVASSANPLPPFADVTAAEVATGGARAAELRGTLVRVRDVTVTNANPDAPDDFGEFAASGLRVDDSFHIVMPKPIVGDQFAILQGVLTFNFSNSKLLPRGPQDIVTGPPSLDALLPSSVFARAGATAMTVPPLEVVLTGPSLGVTTVDLTYGGNVSGPATIAIPDGESRIALSLTAAGTGAGTVTASFDGDTSMASVTVYDNTTLRALETLTPATPTVSINAMVSLTATLTVPAPATGQVVLLTYSAGVSGPATVTVPQDQLSATFNVSAGAAPGSETVTGAVGASMQVAPLTVIAGTPNCLIISEYIEGSGSNNKAFELYNCSGMPMQLSEFGVCLVSNANTTCSAAAPLPVQTLPAAGVFTVCRTRSGAAPDPVADIASNCNFEAGGVANFNGNDRLVVYRDVDGNGQFGAADTVIDAFGELATDPGSIWADSTYRRCNFTPYTGTGAFDVALTYTKHASNDASDYGTAPVETCP